MEQLEKKKYIAAACNALLAIVPEYSPEHIALLRICMYNVGELRHDLLSNFIERWEIIDGNENNEESKSIYRAFIAILRRAEM